MKHTLLVLMFAIAAGCTQQTETSRAQIPAQIVDQAGRVVFPSKVERPTKLNWKTATNGLVMATWSMPEWPFVFCAVRNPTEKSIKYPGGCGLGWWEFTSLLGRNKHSAEWIEIPIRPISPLGTRVVTGVGPIPTDLAPGQEFRASMPSRLGGPRVSLIERNFSFYIDLREYSFPESLSDTIDIKLSSLGYEFPETTLLMETIRNANKAIDSDKK